MLTAVARDQRWPEVVAGISARFSKLAFVLFCYTTNHLTTGPLGNGEFCFPRISMFPWTSSRETLRFSGNKIHCSPRDQSLSISCCGNIVADANVSQFRRWRHVLRKQIFLLGKQKMVLPGVKNIFVSRAQILRPKHMFPSLATPGNITRNIVSATMFPSLDRP